jgi:site-specific DNA-cytosine methylase
MAKQNLNRTRHFYFTFPDSFVIKGAWGEAMRQIGNAVPVLLGEMIGRELADRLGVRNDSFDAKQTYRVS